MSKKKGEYHGGAWKVAYADFVTAMMALFMVLWISSQDDEILISTSEFFQNPYNSPLDQSLGVMPNTSNSIGSGDTEEIDPNNMTDMSFLYSLAKEFYRLLDLDSEDDSKPLEIKVTSDGLRITVFDRAGQPLFVKNSDQFTEWGEFAIRNLSWIMDRYNHKIRIDAHASKGFKLESPGPDYGPWELTVDRANATRRMLVYYALEPGKIDRITGFGDSQPLPGYNPEEDSNQRIEISLVIN